MRTMLPVLALLASGAAAAAPTYTVLDIPECDVTIAKAINDNDVVAGGCGYNGFVRAPDGTYTIFGIENSRALTVTDINASGTVVGWYEEAPFGRVRGFVRAPDGSVSRVKVGVYTQLLAINGDGAAVGEYRGAERRGVFLRQPDGSVQIFQHYKHRDVAATGINASAMVAGSISNGSVSRPYVYADGNFDFFGLGGIGRLREISGLKIDDAGDVAGAYYDGNGFYHGFLRDVAGGTIHTFDFMQDDDDWPNIVALVTVAGDRQVVATAYKDNGHAYGFIRHDDGRRDTFDLSYKGAFRGTYVTDANNSGVVVGHFLNGSGHHRSSFIRTP